MSDIEKRLDKLRELIQERDFLEGKGLSNEVNIRIFCYEPKEEMIVRHFLEKLKDEQLDCHIIHYDLYEVFLDICKEKRILNRISELEEKKGKDFIQKQLERSCDAKILTQHMRYDNHQIGDVVLLSGVGKIFPFMRLHTLLEAMQPLFNDVPILALYPGEFDGHYLKLFNKLKANEYYRAFKVI